MLFLIATVISGQAVLPHIGPTDIYLTALAALLTSVYIVGIIFRSKKQVVGMGVDSLIVLALYLIGIAGLFAITAQLRGTNQKLSDGRIAPHAAMVLSTTNLYP